MKTIRMLVNASDSIKANLGLELDEGEEGQVEDWVADALIDRWPKTLISPGGSLAVVVE